MSTRVYNRGKPNKKFGTLKIETSSVNNLKFDTLLSTLTSESKVVSITDSISSVSQVKGGSSNILIGVNAGMIRQGNDSIAIGTKAGTTDQTSNSIAIGSNAGNLTQSSNSISIGTDAGSDTQRDGCLAIGFEAGMQDQQRKAISLGSNAGKFNQGMNSISIGADSSVEDQGSNSISIGYRAGNTCQRHDSIAIGTFAGLCNQGEYSVAIGSNLGVNNGIGDRSVVIGNNVECTSSDTIAINADSTSLVVGTAGLYLSSITERTSGQDFRDLLYNPTTKQVVYNYNSRVNTTIALTSVALTPSATKTFSFNYSSNTGAIEYQVIGHNTARTAMWLARYLTISSNFSTLTLMSSTGTSIFNFVVSNVNTVNKVITLSITYTSGTGTAIPNVIVTLFDTVN